MIIIGCKTGLGWNFGIDRLVWDKKIWKLHWRKLDSQNCWDYCWQLTAEITADCSIDSRYLTANASFADRLIYNRYLTANASFADRSIDWSLNEWGCQFDTKISLLDGMVAKINFWFQFLSSSNQTVHLRKSWGLKWEMWLLDEI